jgi:transposase
LTILPNPAMMCRRARIARFGLSKTTRKTYTPKFKMAVAIDVVRGEKTLSQVAAEHGVSPSLAAEWRDELLGGADDVFGKTQQDRERKRSEEAARERYDEALRKIGQLTVERDFLQRFCDDNGYDPEEARRGR